MIVPIITKKIEKIVATFPSSLSMLALYYQGMVEREIRLAEISHQDRVLCIGGGAVPVTAIEIARRTGAKVKVIDNDPEAVGKAKNLIKILGLEGLIMVIEDQGESLVISDCSVVHIALQVCPREEVVRHVWQQASPGTRILVRTPKDSLQCFYSSFSKSWNHRCRYVEQKNSTLKATLLLTKGWEGREYEETAAATYSDSFNGRASLVV